MTMRTRKIVIWATLIVVGVPLAVALVDDLSRVVDHVELFASVILILSLALAGWRMKKRLRTRMQRGLGREVQDYELLSIAAWMKIPDEAAEAAKEAERFDFEG